MSFGTNLVKLREEKGISRKELAEQLGIPYTTLRNYEKDQREPGHKLLIDIAAFFSVTVDALIGNRYHLTKAPFACSEEAIELARGYDRLDKWRRQQIRTMLDLELSRLNDQRTENDTTPAAFPYDVIPFRCSVQPASAGTGIDLGPEMFENLLVKKNAFTMRASFGVPVRGDSMEPLYHDGDILLVNGSEEVKPGEIGVFTLDGEGFVKRLGEDVLISINKKYKPIPLTEDARCNGRVIGVLDSSWIV